MATQFRCEKCGRRCAADLASHLWTPLVCLGCDAMMPRDFHDPLLEVGYVRLGSPPSFRFVNLDPGAKTVRHEFE
jgi:hypothetical protein